MKIFVDNITAYLIHCVFCVQAPPAGVSAGHDGARAGAPRARRRAGLCAARGLPLRSRLHRQPQETVQ